jgi:hypothetical protein
LRDELGRLRRDVENGFNRLTNTTVGVGEIMVRYLGVKGIFKFEGGGFSEGNA